MHDYRLDEPEQPECHPDAVKRFTGSLQFRRSVESLGRRIARPQDGWTALKSARVSNSARRPMFHTLYVRKATFISNGLRYRLELRASFAKGDTHGTHND